MSEVPASTRAIRAEVWPKAPSRTLLLESAILLAHLCLALAIRAVGWPEVITPAYLWSRGMLLYRDVKFLHTPGFIGALAVAFRIFGPQTWVIRTVAILGPLASHVLVLRRTRSLATGFRLLVSLFFVVAFSVFDGYAVWPVAIMSVLSLPIATALSRRWWFRAGLLIGIAILLKQTAAYVLIVVAAILAFQSVRAAALAVAGACLPYAVALAGFASLGAGGQMFRWTVLVPFRVQEVTFSPRPFTIGMLGAIFLPTVIAALLERKPVEPESRWLLGVAAGFVLLSYPNFLMLQTLAALPCLAVGASRFLEITSRAPRLLGVAYLAAWSMSGVAILSTAQFDGRILFWNDDPYFNTLIARLDRFPPATRVHSELWGNVLARSQRLPPGTVWVHPWLHWYFAVDDVRARVLAAARAPGTVWVGYRSSLPDGERIGPYAIEVVRAP